MSVRLEYNRCWFNPRLGRTKDFLKMVFIAFLLVVQHQKESLVKKPAISLVFLEKALNGNPSSLCGRQVVIKCTEDDISVPKLHSAYAHAQHNI